MVTNVSEKDKALQEVIDWCEQLEVEGLRLANALLMQREMAAFGVVKGQINAYDKVADHCRSMLGYSGTMPSDDCFWTLTAPEMRASYLRGAREMLEIARKAVSE